VTETLFIAVALVTLLVLTTLLTDAEPSSWRLAAAGLVVGYAVLVRTPGIVLLLAPALIVRARRGSWRGSLRPTAAVLAGAAVLLVPWMLRNAVQVGVWTPTATKDALALCIGHRDGADGLDVIVIASPAPRGGCFAGSPYDDPALDHPDEARWYRTNVSHAIGWAVTHPVDEVRLVFWKSFESMSSESTALFASRQLTDQTWPTPLGARALNLFADAWQWVVLALAGAGLALLPACRRALPIWGLAAAHLVLIWIGAAQPQHKLPMMPLLAILAGAVIGALREQRVEVDRTAVSR
jgi:hypothetical protein